MTLNDERILVLFQTNNDADDLGEFQPAIERYINEGYDRLVEAYTTLHLDEPDEQGQTVYTTLAQPTDAVALPAWMHRAIADYATYMIYRNGNALKQNRGIPYYQMFMEVYRKALQAGLKKRNVQLHGLYKERDVL